jgi:membrane protein DedA with SNARE-associated domain
VLQMPGRHFYVAEHTHGAWINGVGCLINDYGRVMVFLGLMAYDCAVEEPNGTNKIVWILVILIGNFIGAAIYYFARRRNRRTNEAPKDIDRKR